MWSNILLFRWLVSLRKSLRYGESKRSWKPYLQPDHGRSKQAVLMIGGLSSNGAAINRCLAEGLHRSHILTWSRNLYGHTGRFYDFSRSRFWHWISDGIIALRKLIHRFGKRDIVLVGHSTGGLVVLAVLILSRLLPEWTMRHDPSPIRLRGVLIFPPFRLQRRRDAQLLWVVSVLYYLLCPLAFLYLAVTKPGMWPLTLFGYACHIRLVPKIYVPSGDDRASQAPRTRLQALASESVLLAAMCIYFVSMPPLIALLDDKLPDFWSVMFFATFILTLLIPLFIIPRNTADSSVEVVDRCRPGRFNAGFKWLPVITVANLILMQFFLKRFLKYCRSPILLLQGGQDQVVAVEQSWVEALGSNVEFQFLKDYPHSDLSVEQQLNLAELINQWIDSSSTQTHTDQPNTDGSSASQLTPT